MLWVMRIVVIIVTIAINNCYFLIHFLCYHIIRLSISSLSKTVPVPHRTDRNRVPLHCQYVWIKNWRMVHFKDGDTSRGEDRDHCWPIHCRMMGYFSWINSAVTGLKQTLPFPITIQPITELSFGHRAWGVHGWPSKFFGGFSTQLAHVPSLRHSQNRHKTTASSRSMPNPSQ